MTISSILLLLFDDLENTIHFDLIVQDAEQLAFNFPFLNLITTEASDFTFQHSLMNFDSQLLVLADIVIDGLQRTTGTYALRIFLVFFRVIHVLGELDIQRQ